MRSVFVNVEKSISELRGWIAPLHTAFMVYKEVFKTLSNK